LSFINLRTRLVLSFINLRTRPVLSFVNLVLALQQTLPEVFGRPLLTSLRD
jgi:hypothetical protein